jgi:hypothetical protein
MIERHRGDEAFPDDGECFQPDGRGAGSSNKGKVRGTASHPFDEPVRVVLNQGDVDPGMRDVKRRERVEQRGDGARGNHADHQATAEEPVYLIHRLAHGVYSHQYRACSVERGGAGRSQARRAAGSVDEWYPEVVFELADLGADARLADVDTRGRTASSATAMKYSSCLISITIDSSNYPNDLLDF